MTLWDLFVEVVFAELTAIGYCCGSSGCDEIATCTAHWPGQDGRQCDRHRAGLERIAEAMGFKLHTTPLPVRRFSPPPNDSAIRFGLIEII